MGIAHYFFQALVALDEAELLAKPAAVCELGNQRVPGYGPPGTWTRDAIEDSIRHFVPGIAAMPAYSDHPHGTLAGDLYRAAGFRYRNIDIEPGPDTIILDLNNARVTSDLFEEFDIVTNFGTTEHIMDQYGAFRLIHDLARRGGIMMHQVPHAGHPDHCLFSYMPKFFFLLAAANDYEVVDFRFEMAAEAAPLPEYWQVERRGAVLPRAIPRVGVPDQTITFILRKTGSSPFSPPIDLTSHYLLPDQIDRVRWHHR